MRNSIFSLLTGLSLVATLVSAQASSTVSVATIPTGLISTTVAAGTTSHLSVPFTAQPIYTSSVTAVTANTISVGDSPAPFTMNLASPAAPYLVKFLSGTEMGRVLLITANTASTLTLDTTDNSNGSVALNDATFSVASGDTFEIVPATTLASMFGDNSAQNSLKLTGSSSIFTSDTVSIYSASLSRWVAFYFNTTDNCWETTGSTSNANATVLFPYSSLTITRAAGQASASVSLSGRVAEVPVLVKSVGQGVASHVSTGYATDLSLSQINLGSSWVKSTSIYTASTLSIYNASLNRFCTYYQLPDSTWRLSTDATTDQSNTVIAAGSSVTVVNQQNLTGASSFLATSMPYSVN
jgi:uncharacterized protein (TIGR02597 family)